MGAFSLSFFVNEDAKLLGQAVNRTATAFWWYHRPEARHRDVLAGDAVLVGPAAQTGNTQSVPGDVQKLLLEPAIFAVEVKVIGSDRCQGNERRFGDYCGAAAYALSLAEWWTAVTDLRVVALTRVPSPHHPKRETLAYSTSRASPRQSLTATPTTSPGLPTRCGCYVCSSPRGTWSDCS